MGTYLDIVAMDTLVLKHQTISTHGAEQICIAFEQLDGKLFDL